VSFSLDELELAVKPCRICAYGGFVVEGLLARLEYRVPRTDNERQPGEGAMGKDSFEFEDTKQGVKVRLAGLEIYLSNSDYSKINQTPHENPAQAIACVAEMFDRAQRRLTQRKKRAAPT